MINILKRYSAFFVFLFSLLALLGSSVICLNTNVIDNQRFILFVQTMFHTGITFFPMTAPGQPYPDYLSLGTVLSYFTSLPFGHPTVFSMVFPYCLAGALSAMFIYLTAALHDKRWGIYAVFFLFASWKFTDGISSLAVDIYIFLIEAFCFYLLYSNFFKQRKNTIVDFVLLSVSLILGFFARRPIGLLLPTFLLSIFFVLSNQWKEFIALLIISGNIFLWGIALILFKAYQMGGDAFVYQMLMFEGLGRLHNEHSTRLYFCFSNGLANYLITTFFAIVVLYIKRRDVLLNYTSPKDFLFQCCSVWFIMVLLLFTIPNTKEVRYVMPIFLPISLLAGYIFNEKATLEYVPQLRKMLVVTAWLLPIIGLLLILSEWFIQRFTHYLIPASLLSGGLLSLLMLITVYQWIGKRRSSVYFYPMLFILIILYLVLINSFILSPVSLYYDYPQGVNMLLPLF